MRPIIVEETVVTIALCPACKVVQMNDTVMEVGQACSRVGTGASP